MTEKWITVEEATERLEKIRGAAGDPEIAHSMEDALYFDALETIHALTAIVLNVKDVDFERWYA